MKYFWYKVKFKIGKDLVAAYQKKYTMEVFWLTAVWYNKEEI